MGERRAVTSCSIYTQHHKMTLTAVTLEGLGGCVMFARVMLHFNEMRFAFFVFLFFASVCPVMTSCFSTLQFVF